jgi:branched-chain amino acid transport system substrate-binding protein
MKLSRRHRLVAVLGAGALIAAACGNDDDEAEVEEEPGEEQPADEAQAEDPLVLGHIHPETGPLAFLDPPMVAGRDFAVEDINAAGGVLGQDLEVISGDEAGDEARAREEVDRLLSEGAVAIIGAAASGMSQAFIQTLFDNEIAQCSGSNTAPDFSTQENAEFYFRTPTPDSLVGPVWGAELTNAGVQTLSVAGRADDYGDALRGFIVEAAEAEGIEVVGDVTYDPEAATFDAEVGQLTEGNPDAIALASFDEGGPIIKGLIEAGVSPDQIYGTDGIFGPTLPELVDETDPNIIDGLTVIGPAGGAEFNERLGEETGGNLIFGGQYYDCVVVTALAAEAAGTTTDSPAIAAEMIGVTRDGTECATFEECKQLLADGEDIDYQGVSGPLDFDEVGDPTVGRYGIAQFQDGELVAVGEQDIGVEEVEGA